jgi:putative serine protease PepD
MSDARHSRPAGQGPRWLTILLLVVAILIGGVVGGLIANAISGNGSSSANCSATDVANKDLPSVVTISVKSSKGGSTGSGEVIRSDGYILTNNHVISLAATGGGSIEVLFNDGTTVPATLTGRDPQTDLAVIKVAADKSPPPIPLGSSDSVVIGEPVIALGAPLGLSNTVTTGVVSALDRTIEVPSDNGSTALLVSAVQTDAAINPGNSGGTLADCSGDLIGVPSAGASVPNPSGVGSSAGSVGLNFAIPVDVAKAVSDEIIATGAVTHGYFGMSVSEVPPTSRQSGAPEGLYVTSVVPGGPAAEAGIKAGDIITEIDGQPATDPNQIEAATLTNKPGDQVKITYERNGQTTTTTVTLGTEPSAGSS